MANLLRRGQELLARTLKQHGSETVIYRRGAESIEDLKASIGQPNQQFGPEFGGTLQRGDRRELIITAADLVIAGTETKPRIGDLVDIDQGGQTLRFVVSKDGSEPEFELADAFGLMLRIRVAFQKVIA